AVGVGAADAVGRAAGVEAGAAATGRLPLAVGLLFPLPELLFPAEYTGLRGLLLGFLLHPLPQVEAGETRAGEHVVGINLGDAVGGGAGLVPLPPSGERLCP